jgi:hypothetical protein
MSYVPSLCFPGNCTPLVTPKHSNTSKGIDSNRASSGADLEWYDGHSLLAGHVRSGICVSAFCLASLQVRYYRVDMC